MPDYPDRDLLSGTILIVDDDPFARETIGEILLPLECNLEFASSGAEALAMAAELGPDLILLDVMMPAMDGFEACRRLRADPVLGDIPVVMVTALDDRDSRLQGIQAGADDFISKPVDRVELRARAGTIVRLNRHRRLQMERTKFEWAVENSDDGYIMVDDVDRIVYANFQARLFVNLPATGDDTGSYTFLETIRQQYECQPAAAWSQLWDDSDQARYLVRPETQTSSPFWLRVEILDFPPGLETRRMIRLRDVTTLMNTQQDMRGFQRLVSHKLRTPLNGMHASLWLLNQGAAEMSSQEVVEFSEMAFESTERLLEVVQDIVRYVEASTVYPSSGYNLDGLPELVQEITENLGLESFSFSGLEGTEQLLLALPAAHMEMVLREILENSKKFHPEQSPVVAVTVFRPESDQVEIEISDDGVSLSPQQLAGVCAPYYQGEKHFTGECSGTGLGLATVAAVLWQVGGDCWMRNQADGPGVKVTLRVPLFVEPS